MKRIFKILVNSLVVAMLLVSFSSLVACGKTTTKATVTVNVNGEDKVLVMNLDSNLAPKTVEQIKGLMKNGFYNDAFFYKFASVNTKQIMIGDLKMVDGKIEQIKTEGKLPDEVIGEFENGARKGSTVKNENGVVGLWRSWIGSDYKISTGNNSGRATMYLPTESVTDFDGYFCVFATLDLEDDTTADSWADIKEALTFTTDNEDDYETYTVYYVKEGEELVFNCMKSADFKKVEPDNVYEPEKNDLQCYAKYEIKVPVTDKDATVKSNVTVKNIVVD